MSLPCNLKTPALYLTSVEKVSGQYFTSAQDKKIVVSNLLQKI